MNIAQWLVAKPAIVAWDVAEVPGCALRFKLLLRSAGAVKPDTDLTRAAMVLC